MGGVPGNLRILAHQSGIVHADGTLLGAASTRRIRQGGESGRASLCVADSAVRVSELCVRRNPRYRFFADLESESEPQVGEYVREQPRTRLWLIQQPVHGQPRVLREEHERPAPHRKRTTAGGCQHTPRERRIGAEKGSRVLAGWTGSQSSEQQLTAGIVFAHNNNNVVNLGPY